MSIFQMIVQAYDEWPLVPYEFYDELEAGRRDVTFYYLYEQAPADLQEAMAAEITDTVLDMMDKGGGVGDFVEIIEKMPMYLCLSALVENIRAVKERVDTNDLFALGMKLTRESDYVEEVKLGILILGLFEGDIPWFTLRTLGLHSEFTLYVILATRHQSNANFIAFEMARFTKGFGKMAAMIEFVPQSQLQREWLFSCGAQNSVAKTLCATICLEKEGMGQFFRARPMGMGDFATLSRIFAYTFVGTDVKHFEHSLRLISQYVPMAKERQEYTFLDLAAFVLIFKGLYCGYYDEDEKVYDWPQRKENFVLLQIMELMRKVNSDDIMLSQIDDPTEDVSLIMTVYHFYYQFRNKRALLPFERFLPLLEQEPFNPSVMRYVVIDHIENYWEQIIDLEGFIPDYCFSGPLKKGELPPDSWPDLWLIYLVEYMAKIKSKREDVYINCLKARYHAVRSEAIKGLRLMKSEWSEKVIPALEKALKIEPERSVRDKIKRLLNKKETGKE